MLDDRGRLSAASAGLSGLPPAQSGTIDRAMLSSWAGASPTETFSYDFGDAMIAVTRHGSSTLPVVGASHELLGFDGPIPVDDAGNPLGLPNGTNFAYDGMGRLREAQLPTGDPIQFIYDASSRLVAFRQGSADVRFRRVEGRIVAEQEGTATRLYIPGAGLGPVATDTGTSLIFNHHEYGERLAFATDSAGNLIERLEYDAYGQPEIFDVQGNLHVESQVGNRMLLTGQPWFADLGLHSQGLRWFRPEWGRFLAADPLGNIDGPNPFLYAGANPIIFIDPWGLSKQGGAGRPPDPRGSLNAFVSPAPGFAGHLSAAFRRRPAPENVHIGGRIRRMNHGDIIAADEDALNDGHYLLYVRLPDGGATTFPGTGDRDIDQGILHRMAAGMRYSDAHWDTATAKMGGDIARIIGANARGPRVMGAAKTALPGIGRTLAPSAARVSVWSLRPFARGRAIEQALGANLPGNFPVIDRFAGGVATSIKSLDLAAKTYQRPATLTRTVRGYIDGVAGFRGRTWAGVSVRGGDITSRSLDLAVPAGGGSAAQEAALQWAVRYGQSVGVNVRIISF